MAVPAAIPATELDESTLRLVVRGDDGSARALVEMYQRRVFALLSRMLAGRDRATVEDAAQDTFLQVFRGLAKFDVAGPAKLSTWILTIATRRAIDELRRRRPTLIGVIDREAALDRTDDRAHRRELAAAIERAVAELSPELRAVFVLREYHEFEYAEIGEALSIDLGTVKSRLSRGRAARAGGQAHHRVRVDRRDRSGGRAPVDKRWADHADRRYGPAWLGRDARRAAALGRCEWTLRHVRPAPDATHARAEAGRLQHPLLPASLSEVRNRPARGAAAQHIGGMHLYTYAGSANGYKIELLCALLGVTYERTEVKIFEGEGRTPAFLEMNPVGSVPVLRTDAGDFLPESNAILVHVARGTKLWPADAATQDRVLRWLMFDQSEVEPVIGSARFWRLTGRERERGDEMTRRLAWAKKTLEVLDGELAKRPFLAGELTIADVAVYAYTHLAGDVGLALPPNVEAWCRRIEALPGYVAGPAPYDPRAYV